MPAIREKATADILPGTYSVRFLSLLLPFLVRRGAAAAAHFTPTIQTRLQSKMLMNSLQHHFSADSSHLRSPRAGVRKGESSEIGRREEARARGQWQVQGLRRMPHFQVQQASPGVICKFAGLFRERTCFLVPVWERRRCVVLC